jgi:integrase
MKNSRHKFNAKMYQGRARIYTKIAGTVNIQRIWVWDESRAEYVPPVRGNAFEAMRYDVTTEGGRKRVRQSFSTLEEARVWQNRIEAVVNNLSAPEGDSSSITSAGGPLLGDVYAEYHRRKLMKLSVNTRLKYEQYVRLHMQDLLQRPIRSLTPHTIDEWLDRLTRKAMRSGASHRRFSFDHELTFLSGLINYYIEYFEDPVFRSPLRKRHRQDAVLAKAPPKHRDLTEGEFKLFLSELAKGPQGEMFSCVATVQFYQALRISEVAALHFEDLNLNWKTPEDSTLRICRHFVYLRSKGSKPVLMAGFKNASGGLNSVREQPVFQQSFEALKGVFRIGTGLIFCSSKGLPLTYRQIQSAYDDAFRRAGLPYSGTHVLRHGGCRRVYNATKDLAVAQMLLGNADMNSTLVYAKRDKSAVHDFAKLSWVHERAETSSPQQAERN